MSIELNIQDDIDKIAKHFDDWERRQFPYALKQTVNDLSVKAQKQICKRIDQVFDNRINWWTPKVRTGVKVSFATKTSLVASVYTRAHFAHMQEEGGIKYPYSGSRLAVPLEHIPKWQRSSKGLKRSMGDESIFKLGNSIYRRVSNNHLQRLYALTTHANISARLEFKKTATNGFNSNFDKVFTYWFDHALMTAK